MLYYGLWRAGIVTVVECHHVEPDEYRLEEKRRLELGEWGASKKHP